MAGKNTTENLGWLLMVQLGRRLLINDYGVQEGLAYVAGIGEELTAKESVSA
jgi:hypothetical protein